MADTVLSPRADLAARIESDTGSVSILQDASWPTDPAARFRVRMNDEVMLLEGGPGLTYSVAYVNGVLQRGIDGTTAAAHHPYTAVIHLQLPPGLDEAIEAALPEDNANGWLAQIYLFLRKLNAS